MDNAVEAALNAINVEARGGVSMMTWTKRCYFVEPSRFTTLKHGGVHHGFQVEAIVYKGGHRFPTGAPGGRNCCPTSSSHSIRDKNSPLSARHQVCVATSMTVFKFRIKAFIFGEHFPINSCFWHNSLKLDT
jgi:hypothetical protein